MLLTRPTPAPSGSMSQYSELTWMRLSKHCGLLADPIDPRQRQDEGGMYLLHLTRRLVEQLVPGDSITDSDCGEVPQGGWRRRGLSISIGRNHSGAWKLALVWAGPCRNSIRTPWPKETFVFSHFRTRIGTSSGLDRSCQFGSDDGL